MAQRRGKITMIIIKGKMENSGQMKNIHRSPEKRGRKIPKVYWTFIINGRISTMKEKYSKQKFLLLAYYSSIIHQSKY